MLLIMVSMALSNTFRAAKLPSIFDLNTSAINGSFKYSKSNLTRGFLVRRLFFYSSLMVVCFSYLDPSPWIPMFQHFELFLKTFPSQLSLSSEIVVAANVAQNIEFASCVVCRGLTLDRDTRDSDNMGDI